MRIYLIVRRSTWLLLLIFAFSCSKKKQNWESALGQQFSLYPILIDDGVLLASICGDTPCLKYFDLYSGETYWESKSELYSEVYYNSNIPVIEGKIIIPLTRSTIAINAKNGNTDWVINHERGGDKNIYTYENTVCRSIYSNDTTFVNLLIDPKSGEIIDSIQLYHPQVSTRIIRSPKVISGDNELHYINTVLLYNTLESTKSNFRISTMDKDLQEYRLCEENKKGYGATQAPLILEKRSYWQIDKDIMCYDHSLDQEIWRTLLPHGSLTSRMILDGDNLIIPCENEFLYALDIFDGKILWKTETAGTPSRIHKTESFYYLIGGSDGMIHKIDRNKGMKVDVFDVDNESQLERISFINDDLLIVAYNNQWHCIHTDHES